MFNKAEKDVEHFKESATDAVKKQHEALEQLNAISTKLKMEEQSHIDYINQLNEQMSTVSIRS